MGLKDSYAANSEVYYEEKLHLDGTIHIVNEEIKKVSVDLDRINSKMRELRGEFDSESNRDLYIYSTRKPKFQEAYDKYNRVLDNPYFARVDFKFDDEKTYNSIYIGKTGFKEESSYGVVDWREPIAEAFYNGESGKVKYKVNGILYSGTVKLKRQFVIEKSKLIKFSDDLYGEKIANKINLPETMKTINKAKNKKMEEQDIEKVSSEDIFLDKLSRSAENRLKDIIETIKAEQNKIIRQPLDRTIIVQGAAGSGKSTVGLHRISYLLYNYKKANLKPEDILVIAPNKVFLNYISELLPGMDSNGVNQYTLEELAYRLLGKKVELNKDEKTDFLCNNANKSLGLFLKEAISSISKFKGSVIFKDIIDNYIGSLLEIIKSTINTIEMFSGKLVITRDEQLRILSSNSPFNQKLEELRQFLESKFRVYFEQKSFFSIGVKGQKMTADSFINQYFESKRKIEVRDIYKKVFSSEIAKKATADFTYYSFVSEYTLKLLNQNLYEREDLAAICYLKKLIEGLDNSVTFRHIFVDEAQDLSQFEFVLLKEISSNNSLTIMGDTNQCIFSHRGIEKWDELIKGVFKDNKCDFYKMLNSYRSTYEIVNSSNKLITDLTNRALAVKRRGEEVQIYETQNKAEQMKKVFELIKTLEKKGCKSIGILAKKDNDCKLICSQLKKAGISNFSYLDEESQKYSGGITVSPIILSKGLEFDGVILWDVSENSFENNDFDRKALYVAVTRPLNYLYMIFRGKLSTLIEDFH
jgi:DNA helicase II / ATP-dependent DNA helicase PcrA